MGRRWTWPVAVIRGQDALLAEAMKLAHELAAGWEAG